MKSTLQAVADRICDGFQEKMKKGGFSVVKKYKPDPHCTLVQCDEEKLHALRLNDIFKDSQFDFTLMKAESIMASLAIHWKGKLVGKGDETRYLSIH